MSPPQPTVAPEARPTLSVAPDMTVVIPTRDRAERLAETLAALAAQDGVAFEVVVVDDGSRDATHELLESERAAALDLRWQRQDREGPAAARNRAVSMARAERVLLLGDDTRPAPGALRAHLEAAAGRDVAVQGHIDWDPEAPVTDVMRFLAPAGPQFYFAGFTDGEPIPYTGVLASNLSAPTAWLRDDPFDEGFPDAAFEDTELAYRWRRKGRGAIYGRRALCWHRHHYETLEPFLERQRRAGRAARHAVARHARLAWPVVVEPSLFGVWVAARHAMRCAVAARRDEDAWDLRCRGAFLRGFLKPNS